MASTVFFHDHAFNDFRAGADEAAVFNDGGVICSGSSTPPMPTPPDRWTSQPIWAHEPTGGPGVDHGALST